MRGRSCRVEPLLARRTGLVSELRELLGHAVASLSEALATPMSCVARLRSQAPAPRETSTLPVVLCLLHLEGPRVAAVLELELRFAVGLVARLAGAPLLSTPVLGLTAFEQAVLAHLVLVALAALRTRPAAEQRWRPRLVGVTTSPHEREVALGRQGTLGVDLEFRAGDQSGRGALLVPEVAVQHVVLGTDVEPFRDTGAARGARFPFHSRIPAGCSGPVSC